MAVISETVTIAKKQYRKTYSDSGYYIERDGAIYSEAIDVLDSDFEYTETNIPVETDKEIFI